MMICVYEFYFDERDVDYANKSYIYIYVHLEIYRSLMTVYFARGTRGKYVYLRKFFSFAVTSLTLLFSKTFKKQRSLDRT